MLDQEERLAFREQLAEILAGECVNENLHKLVESAEMRSALQALLAESGWYGVVVPEAFGGLGLTDEVLFDAYIELGKVLSPVHLLPTQLAVKALLLAASNELQKQYLPRIARGELLATVSSPESAPEVKGDVQGDAVQLNGTVTLLPQAARSGIQIVKVAVGDGQTDWVLIDTEQDQISISEQAAVDLTRSFGQIEFSNKVLPSARLLGGNAGDISKVLEDHAAMAIACDSLGAATTIFDITVEYLKIRTQFDKPIGSFQALKHNVASHKVQLEAISDLVSQASDKIASAEDANYWASTAKFMASDMFNAVASDAVQLHGGIGFTWEHVCHLYVKRAKLNQHIYGDVRHHKLRSYDNATALGLQASC